MGEETNLNCLSSIYHGSKEQATASFTLQARFQFPQSLTFVCQTKLRWEKGSQIQFKFTLCLYQAVFLLTFTVSSNRIQVHSTKYFEAMGTPLNFRLVLKHQHSAFYSFLPEQEIILFNLDFTRVPDWFFWVLVPGKLMLPPQSHYDKCPS